MQIKNSFLFIIFFIIGLFSINSSSLADEFDITAAEITVDKKNNILIGKGSVEIRDKDGRLINADKMTYEKSKEFLFVEGSVEIIDKEGNIIKTDRATYDKLNEIINTLDNSEVLLKNDGYKLNSNNLIYNTIDQRISSNQNSIFTDVDGNIVYVENFQHDLVKNLFSSVGKIKVIDTKKNKYHFKEIYVDTKSNEMIGSDVSVVLDEKNFGVEEENDPRFVANDIYLTKERSKLTKGVFTVCKKREDDKCPPWTIQAKKITHDRIKKTIYYDHATLKVYDVPIFYFPKFFHPDPTVKRKSGFLAPFFTTSTTVGPGFGLPYFWAVSHDKDLTITPKIYSNENVLLLNEYRQAFKNGFLTLDTSYTEGYKDITSTKTSGSRNHIFGDLRVNLAKDNSYESSLNIKTQRTSNDTYFRVHNIDTALVDSGVTDLENKINYNFAKDNTFVNVSAALYENLREETNDRYEYVLPNILFGKTFFTKKFGIINFKSNTLYKNYDADKHTTFVTNDIIWSPNTFISKKGFVNTLEGMIKNTNYEAKNTTDYKTKGTVNEIDGVLSYKSSFPMKKDSGNFLNIFSPNLMFRYSPMHMRNLSGDDVSLRYTNLYSLNKTSEIEDGLSAILGFDYKKNEKLPNGSSREKFSLSVGQIFNREENKDMPRKSSLHQKTSDVVGEMNYNFSKIGNIGYKFSLDENLNDLNYNEVSTSLNFGKVAFNLDYLEETNHVGNEHYVNAGVSLNFNNNNSLSFETKKNYKTSSTEFYDISYQYKIDCLAAGLVYRREFYRDSDIEQKNSLMFKITFIPFGGINTPTLINQ